MSGRNRGSAIKDADNNASVLSTSNGFENGDWKELSLGEAKVKLIDCDHRTPPRVDVGYPYVTIPQLRDGRIDLSEVRRISREHYLEWTKKARPQEHDVVLSRRCNPGETAFVPADLEFALGQNLVLLRADGTRIYPPFLRWLARGPEWWEQIGKFLNVGAVFDSLKCADIPNFRFQVPPLEEQHAIACFLGTIDAKIELSRQMNATLEAMARALFKSWFVDFDPVRAKAEGRDTGLSAHIASLFPDSFEDSALGEIPAGWRATTLGAEAKQHGGRIQTGPFGSQLHASDYSAEGIPVVMPQDIADRRVSTVRIARINEADARRLARHRLETGDIIYSRRGDVERHAQISAREVGWLCGTGCLLVRMGPQWPTSMFMSLLLDRPESRAWITQHAIGATMPNLNTGILSAVPLVVPPDELLKAFARLVEPIEQLISARNAEAHILEMLRDALLPKLISGELQIPQADHAMEAHI